MKVITDEAAEILLPVLEASCTKGFIEVIAKFSFISDALVMQKARLLLAPRANARRGSLGSKSYLMLLEQRLGKCVKEIQQIEVN